MQYVGIMLAILTIVTIIYAAYTLYCDHLAKKQAGSLPAMENTDHSPVLPYLSGDSMEASPAEVFKENSFERFILEKFDKRHFRYVDGRSDTSRLEAYSLTSTYPDLLFEYRHAAKSVRFAVECKWRTGFRDDAIHWAKSWQVDNYYAYQAKEQITVYVVIGIGGSPELPQELYVIPLHKIHQRQLYLTAYFLKPYGKPVNAAFSFDLSSLTYLQ